MRFKRLMFEEGFLDCTSRGFGMLHMDGVINHVNVSFDFNSDEAWYLCFEPESRNLAFVKSDEEEERIKKMVLGVALLHADERGGEA